MGVKGAKHWSKIDNERLRMFWPTYPKSELLRMLPGRSLEAIAQQATKQGIKRKWKWGGALEHTKDPIMSELRSARENKRISAAELSRRIGLATGFVAKCERGRAGPSYHMLTRWCAALGVSLKVEKATNMRAV